MNDDSSMSAIFLHFISYLYTLLTSHFHSFPLHTTIHWDKEFVTAILNFCDYSLLNAHSELSLTTE